MALSELDPAQRRELVTRDNSLSSVIGRHATVLVGMLGLMWLVGLLGLLPGVYFEQYGIRPRTVAGLWGILTAPFIHRGLAHLIGNSVPFLVLGAIVLLGGRRLFWAVTMFVIIFGGLGVWIFARPSSVHIGASGLIFGYLGFLLTRGIVERSVVWTLVAVAIFIGYGGFLWGILPLHYGISWQGHLSGLLAGFAAAKLLVGQRQKALMEDVPETDRRLD